MNLFLLHVQTKSRVVKGDVLEIMEPKANRSKSQKQNEETRDFAK
jgi:hypothetical protein